MRDKYLTGAVVIELVLITIYLINWPIKISSIQLISATAFLGITAGIHVFTQNKQVSSLLQEMEIERSSNPSQSVDINQIEEILDSFSEEHYHEDNEAKIRWDLADFDTKPLRKWDEYLVCITGVIGQNRRKIQVFIETTSGTIVTHKRIRAGSHQEKYPFKYSDYYQEYKRDSTSKSIDNSLQQGQWTPYMGPRMPPNSRFQNSGQNNSENKSEGETGE